MSSDRLHHVAPDQVIACAPWREDEETIAYAEDLGAWFGCKVVSRKNRSIRRLLEEEHALAAVVADENPKLYSVHHPEQPMFIHPGMAMQRVFRQPKGASDRLMRVAEVRPGYHVFDATFGQGIDSLVFASAVGHEGSVTACEVSWCVAKLFTYAARRVWSSNSRWSGAFNRIHLNIGNHKEMLASMPDDSVDVVYFDPMFRDPVEKPTTIDVARDFVYPDPISGEAWLEAQRVARRCVVLKERLMSGQLERFGLSPDKRGTPFVYGVWRKG